MTKINSSFVSPRGHVVASTGPGFPGSEDLTSRQQAAIVQTAAKCIGHAVTGHPVSAAADVAGDLSRRIVMGVFVTLKRGGKLRGCRGVLGKPMRLGEAISTAAILTAKNDTRFTPISPTELDDLTIAVTLLGPYRSIDAEGNARADAIEIGKHGLKIQYGGKSGLLLPCVATERGWDARRFLQAVCTKAGLPISTWEKPDAKLVTFEGKAMSGALADYLPENPTKSTCPPVSLKQLTACARQAGQNIVAISSGGSPDTEAARFPDVRVNALVFSMQWEAKGSGKRKRCQNTMQVCFEREVALQTALNQLCRRAAHMFQQQRFVGQLRIGLTMGFYPVPHGKSHGANLDNIDSTMCGLVISDATNLGFAFDPGKTAGELREMLGNRLPENGGPDATLHSMQVISTRPQVVCVHGREPLASEGVRPPAVAGTFYPARDAARREMVATLFQQDEPAKSNPLAIMVPHAGLKYSGRIAAGVWRRLESAANRTLLIISPKHGRPGVSWSVCPCHSWRISETTSFRSDPELASLLVEKVGPLQLDPTAHRLEHGIEVQLPILEQVAPDATVVGMALHGGSWIEIQSAAKEMAEVMRSMTNPPLLVISSDMNHYAPDEETRRRDRLALDAMKTCDPKRLIDTCNKNEISMCGLVPAALVMETLCQLNAQFTVDETGYATSAEVSGDKSKVVGYAGLLLSPVG